MYDERTKMYNDTNNSVPTHSFWEKCVRSITLN